MFFVAVFAVLLVILDQLSKWLAVVYLSEGASRVFIPYIIEFTYHENRGAAWGMFSNHRWVFMLTSTVAIVFIIAFLAKNIKKVHPVLTVSLTMILAGGIGNMIDRLFIGYVVDFINFLFIDFPVFNVADICVTVGAGMMLVWLLFFDLPAAIKEDKENKTAKTEEK